MACCQIRKRDLLIGKNKISKFRIVKIICLLIVVSIGQYALGQSPIELDKENGFGDYKIGTKLSSLESKKLKLLDENLQNQLFKTKEKATINGMKGGEVELVFYKNRLVEITIVFHRRTADEYDSLRQTLEQQYGPPKDKSYSKKKPAYLTTFDKIFEWEGLVMGLQYNYDVSHKVIELVYWGLKERTPKSKENF